uniref:Uncharacterized protein n=1 Tax=Rhizophora mucronata TaxID=61149 RepID=A0A2P2QNV8_RHIMU
MVKIELLLRLAEVSLSSRSHYPLASATHCFSQFWTSSGHPKYLGVCIHQSPPVNSNTHHGAKSAIKRDGNGNS